MLPQKLESTLSQFSSHSSSFREKFRCLFHSTETSVRLFYSPLLWRSKRQDHPPDHEVEEEHRVHHQRLAVGRLTVGEEGRGGEGGPAEGHRHHHQPHGKADRARAAEQDDPTHGHGCCQRHDAVSQNTQALEEGDGPAQKFGVEGDDDGAEPDDDEDLDRGKDNSMLEWTPFKVRYFTVCSSHLCELLKPDLQKKPVNPVYSISCPIMYFNMKDVSLCVSFSLVLSILFPEVVWSRFHQLVAVCPSWSYSGLFARLFLFTVTGGGWTPDGFSPNADSQFIITGTF